MKLKYCSITPGSTILKFKTSVDDEPSTTDFGKRNSKIGKVVLSQAYPHGNLLSKPKYDDVVSLLFYAPLCYHEYFKNLPHESECKDNVIPHLDIGGE